MTKKIATERRHPEEALLLSVPVLAGRERELAALTRALAGPPAVVLVEGEAGIGKTRLVRESVVCPAGQRLRAVSGNCPPFRRPCTLGPVIDAVRQATSSVADLRLTGLAGALRPLFPEWAGDLPPLPEPAEDATAARHRLFRALAELLGCLGVTVLVVEDVHWADQATMEFLLFLASRDPRMTSLVVTCRPEDVSAGSLFPELTRMASGAAGLRVTLGPLNLAATASLVSSMLAGQHITGKLAQFVHQHSEGVPLVAEELVRLMGDRADLAHHDGRWIRRSLTEIAVPPTIRDAVLERASKLSPDAQAVLRAAAVLTDPAGDMTLRAVAALPVSRMRTGLAEALGSHLLADDGLRTAFRHALAAQAVYEAIPAPLRRFMHLRAGRVLERMSPPPAAQLVRHFREGGDTSKWGEHAIRAADLAIASGDEAGAAALLTDLLTSGNPSARSTARLISKLPLASLTGLDRYQPLVDVLRSALDAGVSDPAEEADARLQLGRVLVAMEDNEAARVELERAIPHLGHDPGGASWAMIHAGWPPRTRWPVAAHLQWLQRAATAAESATLAPADQLRFTVDRVTALLLLGRREGWAEAARIPDDARTAGERLQVARGHFNVGEEAMRWGRYDQAAQTLAAAKLLAERHQYQRFLRGIMVAQAHLQWFTGDWGGLAERVATLADDDMQPVTRAEAVLIRGLAHAATGNHGQAEECFAEAVTVTRRCGALEYTMEPAAALARIWLSDGRVEEALRLTDELTDVVTAKGTWLWATDVAPVRLTALILAGRPTGAAELLKALARGLHGCDAPAAQAGLSLCRAILTESQADHSRAAALFAATATAWQALPRPYDALLARERQARCLLAAGQRDGALAVLGEVLRELSALGATADASRVARCMREHGLRVHRPGAGRPSSGGRLSPRELDVVRLLAAGQTDDEIAQSLFLSPATVASHVASARRKLRAATRTALAVRAIEAGIVPICQTAPADGQPNAHQAQT